MLHCVKINYLNKIQLKLNNRTALDTYAVTSSGLPNSSVSQNLRANVKCIKNTF